MEESANKNKKELTLPSDANDDNSKLIFLGGKQWKSYIFTPSSVTRVLVRFSGHALRWVWSIEGNTNRTPKKIVRMRGWEKRIYEFKGATIILNKSTFELWLRSRPYKTVERMIYSNWNKADIISREFRIFARIGLKPIQTEHPANIKNAHLVMTNKKLNPILKPMSEVKDEVGLLFDKSHKDFPEMTGRMSAEGARGAEWFFIEFPKIVQYQVEMDTRYARNLELHLSTLVEMKDTLKKIKEALEVKK